MVWARSVGLEVINELDTIKAALMITAGSGGGDLRVDGGGWGWDAAARGLENFSSASAAAKVVGTGLASAVGAGLQQLGNALSRTGRQ